METLRRDLSARLPEARLLEFTFDDPDPATPRIELPDEGTPMSGRGIVTTALALLRANYVFREVADRAATAAEARLAAGEYDDLDESALAERLTSDLNEICDDKHLRVWAPRGSRAGGPDPRPGGPGYLVQGGAPVPAIAGPAMAAAMELVPPGPTRFIIDLRRNGGGAPDGVVFWCSYLFGDQPTHLNDIFRADTGKTAGSSGRCRTCRGPAISTVRCPC